MIIKYQLSLVIYVDSNPTRISSVKLATVSEHVRATNFDRKYAIIFVNQVISDHNFIVGNKTGKCIA